MCDQKTLPRDWSVRSLHVEAVLDGSTGDLFTMLGDEGNVGQGRCGLVKAEVFVSKDTKEVIFGHAASTELGNGDECAVAECREKECAELQRSEAALMCWCHGGTKGRRDGDR